MCLAIPARIVTREENNMANVDIMGVSRTVSLDLVPEAVEGDFILVHAGFAVYDEGLERCGIVTLASTGGPSDALLARLAEHRINATTTPAGSSRWDVERRNLPVLLRLSVHYTTTDDELDRTVAVLTGGR